MTNKPAVNIAELDRIFAELLIANTDTEEALAYEYADYNERIAVINTATENLIARWRSAGGAVSPGVEASVVLEAD